MRLTLTLTLLVQLLAVSPAFSFTPPSLTRTQTRARARLHAVDPSALVEAYQKNEEIGSTVAAAAAVAGKAAVATQAAPSLADFAKTSMRTTGVGEKVAAQQAPSFADFVKTSSSNVRLPDGAGASSFNVLANAKEKLAIMKDNVIALPAAASKGAATKLTASAVGITTGSSGDFMTTINAMGAGLNLEEYGIYYAAGIAFFLALAQRQAGKEKAEVAFRDKLEVQGEQEIAAATTKAPTAATTTTTTTGASSSSTSSKDSDGNGQGSSSGAAEKAKSSSSTSNVGDAMLESSRLRQMEVDQQFMKVELSKLVTENQRLQKMLDATAQEKAKVTKDKQVAKAATAAPKKVMATDPQEEQRVLDIIKELDEKNKQKTTTAVPSTKKEPAAKKVSPKRVVEPEPVVVAEPEPEPVVVAEPEPEPQPEPVVAADNPWKELTEATLKRKTVAQLVEYLTERGVGVLQDNGKKMTKATLISALRSL